MCFVLPVPRARLDQTALALMSIQVVQSFLAVVQLTYFYFSSFLHVTPGFYLLLAATLATTTMLLPYLVCIFICSHSKTHFTDRTDYYVQLVGSAAHDATMVVRSFVIGAEEFAAPLAFKGHEVALITLMKVTALSYLFL